MKLYSHRNAANNRNMIKHKNEKNDDNSYNDDDDVKKKKKEINTRPTSSADIAHRITWKLIGSFLRRRLKIRKKRKYGNKRNFYINIHLKVVTNGIHSLLKRADAKESANLPMYVTHIGRPIVFGSGSYRHQKVGHTHIILFNT